MYFPDNMTFQYFFFDTYIGYFLQTLPFALLSGMIYGIIRCRNDKKRSLGEKIFSCAFVFYVSGLVCLTIGLDLISIFWYELLYSMESGLAVGWFSGCFDFSLDFFNNINGEAVGNFLMFLPFGILYPLSHKRPTWKGCIINGLVAVASIELLQPVFGRSFDINDIILNSIGIITFGSAFFWAKKLFAKIHFLKNDNTLGGGTVVRASSEFLRELEKEYINRKEEIRVSDFEPEITGSVYYVSESGDDSADGTSEDSAWRTLARVSAAQLSYGDAVLFHRGDLFRGQLNTVSGVTYAAYGVGEKPRLYAGDRDLADPSLWVEHAPSIWKLTEPICDCGTLVFDHGKRHSRKLIPSYNGTGFVCREDESRAFDVVSEMTCDLDIFCRYDERCTTSPSKGEDFPVPILDKDSIGELFLRCDEGNPGSVFTSIEPLVGRNLICVGKNDDVTVADLCLKYVGAHAISAGGRCVKNLRVHGCEIGWVGGTIQHYFGTDPNYPQGRR